MTDGIKSIKFHLDKSLNKYKKDKIMRFLQECQTVENKLLVHYWDNFNLVTNCRTKIDFNYNKYKVEVPRIKSHHYQQILQMVFAELKSLQTRIKNMIHFEFEEKSKQRIYNYCAKFCFEWDKLNKHINKQIKKIKDEDYVSFLSEVKSYINSEESYSELKELVETKFYEIKDNKFKLPVKKEFQILCTTAHTVNIEMKEFQWVFIIDNNDIIGGTNKKPVFDDIVMPVKFSKYHKKKLTGEVLKNTFNLKLNKYGKIEIIGAFETEEEYPINNPNDYLGVDIGLKKLITTSDGEYVNQNYKIVKLAKEMNKIKSNRNGLLKHLKQKYKDDNLELPNKNYLRKERRLTQFVKCDNRFKIKNFLKDRKDYHIIIEDLEIGYSRTHNKETNYLLRRLHIQQLKDDLLKYCKQFGIAISKVNASYTSQQCSNCGYTHKNNRKTQEKFSCQCCGHESNADVNAAINIMNRFFDKRITLNTPNWRLKEILNISD